MSVQEKILNYLSVYGKDNEYRMSRALKIDVNEVTEALDVMEKEGKIEMKEGKASLARKKLIGEAKQEIEKSNQEEAEEGQLQTEILEEIPLEESFEPKIGEEAEQERIKGTVKFYNPNKGFGFIRGDDGQEYRVHESALKEGFIIKADDGVSFKVFHGHKCPEADNVEAVNQNATLRQK